VLTVKIADLLPAKTVTDAGTCAKFESDVSRHDKFVAAACVRVKTPVHLTPPGMLFGLNATLFGTGAKILIGKLADPPPPLPEIWELASTETGTVETVNDADCLPAGITTVAGTLADASVLERFTVNPAAPAFWLILTVPTDGSPPKTFEGVTLRDVTL